MIYLVAFSVTILSSYFASFFKKRKKKIPYWLLKIAAIIIPALLAGFRGNNVGTDVSSYLVEDYRLAVASDSPIDYLASGYGEPLFLLLIYSAVKLFANFNVVLFVIQLLIMILTYKACEDFEDSNGGVPVFLSYAFFLFIYYNQTLNLLRQSIALSIALLSYRYLVKNKNVPFLLLTVLACLFHKTALIMLLVWVIYKLQQKMKYAELIITVMALLVVLFFDQIISAGVYFGFLSRRYLYYIESGNVDVSLAYIGLSLLIIIGIIIYRKKLILRSKDNSLYIFMNLINVILLLLSFKYNSAIRLTYFFGYVNVLLVPQIVQILIEHRRRKIKRFAIIVYTIYFVSLSFYHLVYYSKLENHQTYPYRSEILKIDDRKII